MIWGEENECKLLCRLYNIYILGLTILFTEEEVFDAKKDENRL